VLSVRNGTARAARACATPRLTVAVQSCSRTVSRLPFTFSANLDGPECRLHGSSFLRQGDCPAGGRAHNIETNEAERPDMLVGLRRASLVFVPFVFRRDIVV
jgi:hypothetical protein